ACARLWPVTSATTRSRRSPSSAGGTTSRVRSSTGPSCPTARVTGSRPLTRRALVPPGEDQQHGTAHDGDVGQVEHRPPLQIDEVDHPAAEHPVAGPEGAVDQVADRTARHE